MANRDVTLKIGEDQVFPRTYVRNIMDIVDGKQQSLTDVLAQIKGDVADNQSRISNHQTRIESLENFRDNFSVSFEAVENRVAAVENRVTTNEGSIENINKTLESHDGRITKNAQDIEAINKLIPSAAKEGNQLADKNFVNDAIQNISAYYITNAEGNAFATYAELEEATANGQLYSGGELRTNPTRNDYAIVLSDETKLPEGDVDGNPTTRYIYDEGWKFQYIVNNTAFTQAQVDAINSGITADLVAKITANETAIGELSTTVSDNKTEIDGRLDSAEARLDAIDGEEGRLAAIETAASELAQTVADNKTELDERIDNIINSNLGGLDKEIAEINADITALQQELNGIPADPDVEGSEAVVGIKERLATAESDIDAVEGRVEATEGRLDAIDGEEGRLAQVEGRVTVTEADIAAIRAELDGVPADETAGTEAVPGIYDRLDNHDEQFVELRDLIDQKQADLAEGEFITITEDESGAQVIDVKVDFELSNESRNPVANHVIKAELDKKVECTDVVDYEGSMEAISAEGRVSSLEAQVRTLLNEVARLSEEVENLKKNNGGSVEGSAPEYAPTVTGVDNENITFQEVEGATGYNVYVDGEHRTKV